MYRIRQYFGQTPLQKTALLGILLGYYYNKEVISNG